VWRSTLFCVAFSGCGFNASVQQGDGPHADAAGPRVDGAIDGMVTATTCMTHWLDGSVAVSAPQELSTLSTTGSERDPWISSDGLTLYYAGHPLVGGTSEIYRASRASTAQLFGNPAAQLSLNRSDSDESRAALTPDEKMLVLASNRGIGAKYDVYITTRSDTALDFGSPDMRHMVNVDAGNDDDFDPFLTFDGLRLYLAPAPPVGSGRQHISLATRPDTGSDFSSPVPVPALMSQSLDGDPALSLDERIIVFSSTRSGGMGGTDLWYATRPSATASFGTPKPIPTVNGSMNDGDPMLSADGCELYFSSSRTGGDYDLYVATITP